MESGVADDVRTHWCESGSTQTTTRCHSSTMIESSKGSPSSSGPRRTRRPSLTATCRIVGVTTASGRPAVQSEGFASTGQNLRQCPTSLLTGVEAIQPALTTDRSATE